MIGYKLSLSRVVIKITNVYFHFQYFHFQKNLNGHKNIIGYVDHSLGVNKAGVYDYMLLSLYYKCKFLYKTCFFLLFYVNINFLNHFYFQLMSYNYLILDF